MDPLVRDLVIVLLAAHAVGDFLLQTGEIVAQRNAKTFLLTPYLKHALAHFAAAYVALGAWGLWYGAALLAVVHCAVDFAKDHTTRRSAPPRPNVLWNGLLFLLDQAAHVAIVIAAAVLLAKLPRSTFCWLANEEGRTLQLCLYLIGLIVAAHFGAVVIDIFVRPLLKAPAAGESDAPAAPPLDYGLQRTIGLLDRSLIFLAVVTGFVWVVALLAIVKAIASRGAFRKAPAFAATAMAVSFLWALGASALTKWILDHSASLLL